MSLGFAVRTYSFDSLVFLLFGVRMQACGSVCLSILVFILCFLDPQVDGVQGMNLWKPLLMIRYCEVLEYKLNVCCF